MKPVQEQRQGKRTKSDRLPTSQFKKFIDQIKTQKKHRMSKYFDQSTNVSNQESPNEKLPIEAKKPQESLQSGFEKHLFKAKLLERQVRQNTRNNPLDNQVVKFKMSKLRDQNELDSSSFQIHKSEQKQSEKFETKISSKDRNIKSKRSGTSIITFSRNQLDQDHEEIQYPRFCIQNNYEDFQQELQQIPIPLKRRNTLEKYLNFDNEENDFQIKQVQAQCVCFQQNFYTPPRKINIYRKQDFQVERKNLSNTFGQKQSDISGHEKQQSSEITKGKTLRNRNPYLSLTYEDFLVRFSTPLNIELHETKKKDKFLNFYHNSRFQPMKNELKEKISEQIKQLMNIKQGRYLSQLILAQAIDQCIQINLMNQEIDKQLVNIQIQLEGFKSNQFKKLNKDQLNQNELSVILESQQIQFKSPDEDYQSLLQNTTQVSIQESQQVLRCPLLQKSPQEFNLSEKFQTQQHQEQQIKLLKEQISKLQSKIQEEKQSLRCLQLMLEQSITILDLTEVNQCNVAQQFNEIQKNVFIVNQYLMRQLSNIRTLKEQLFFFVQKQKNLNYQKLNQLLQHFFDVLFIELQIFSNKEIKSILKNASKNNSISLAGNLQQILIELYEKFMKLNSISLFLGKKIAQDSLKNSLSPSTLKMNQFYKKMEWYLRFYLCVKIHQSFWAQSHLKQQKCFLSQFFNLLDKNSYHSEVTKQRFFYFTNQFLTYGKIVFNQLESEIYDSKHLISDTNDFFKENQLLKQSQRIRLEKTFTKILTTEAQSNFSNKKQRIQEQQFLKNKVPQLLRKIF